MRPVPLRVWAALALLAVAGPCLAASPLPLVLGSSREGALYDLQKKLDRYVGAGRIQARTDYVGARPGDPDPWVWLNPGKPMLLTLLDRKSAPARIGWYAEGCGVPLLNGATSAVVFDQNPMRGDPKTFRVPSSTRCFGFFVAMDDAGASARSADGFTTFTNRMWNSPGPGGTGAMHEPYDGDIQMLVYDISRWAGPQTWLVACEASDSGARIGHGPDDSDNDFTDYLFTVTGVGITPTKGVTFGELKSRFR